jgi:hypothetical protein
MLEEIFKESFPSLCVSLPLALFFAHLSEHERIGKEKTSTYLAGFINGYIRLAIGIAIVANTLFLFKTLGVFWCVIGLVLGDDLTFEGILIIQRKRMGWILATLTGVAHPLAVLGYQMFEKKITYTLDGLSIIIASVGVWGLFYYLKRRRELCGILEIEIHKGQRQTRHALTISLIIMIPAVATITLMQHWEQINFCIQSLSFQKLLPF